jgi:hypothetical protein
MINTKDNIHQPHQRGSKNRRLTQRYTMLYEAFCDARNSGASITEAYEAVCQKYYIGSCCTVRTAIRYCEDELEMNLQPQPRAAIVKQSK